MTRREKPLTFFVSDVHLGSRAGGATELERRFLHFLDHLPEHTRALYLLGDIFDFWYEYKYVIPAGYTRVLGRLAALVDRGVKVYFMAGNHDVWAYRYFEQELGLIPLTQPAQVEIDGKRFCLGHGDGLGPVPMDYRFLRGVFHCRFLQVLFSALHPRWAFGLGYAWSRHSRLSKAEAAEKYVFQGEQEPLWKYAQAYSQEQRVDYFVFGHYHTPYQATLPGGAQFFILGDWIHGADYLCFDGERLTWGQG